jgi:hypothetical protein
MTVKKSDEAKKSSKVKVVATQPGFYDNTKRETGDEFLIEEKDFSDVWMERVHVASHKKTESKESK